MPKSAKPAKPTAARSTGATAVLAPPAAVAPVITSAGSAAGDGPFAALREQLQVKRKDLLALYKKDVRVGQESGDEGTEDIVDRANNAYNRELMFSLSDAERQLLLQVDDALVRMEKEIFGACSSCGREIAPLRLKAIPWARYCIDCQELDEKGMLQD